MPQPIGKLNGLVLAVRNMDKSVKFYRDVLGLKVDYKADDWSELRAGSFFIGLYEGKPRQPAGGVLPKFEVTSIKRAVARLKKKRVKFVDEPYEEDHGWMAVFCDPDGYCYELYQEK